MSYIDTFDIVKAIAPETYSKSPGKIVELDSGLKKNRLKFELHSNESSAQVSANVYVEVIGNGFFEYSKSFILSIMSIMHLKFIKTTYRGKIIYININSLTSRLGIKVEKTYSEKIFHSELKKHLETVLETKKKIDIFFQKIIKEKYIEDDNELRTTNGEPISKAYFRKLLGLTAFSMFNSVQKQKSSYLLKDGNILFLKKEKNKEWPLLTLFTMNILGEGSFGTVLLAKELSIGRVSVAKIAHISALSENIKNEDLILSTLFNNSNPVGIQQKPYSLFNFRLEGINYSGYIAPKYDSSLDSIMQKLKVDEKIEATRQLLKGLQELEKQQISHGDIKEANCLFQRKSDTSIECVIADFGGATDLSKQAEWSSEGTPFYELEEDYIAYQSLYKQKNFEKTKKGKDKINTDIIKVLLRRDVYAMGTTLANLLAGSKVKNKKKLCFLINQMLEVSWEKRISASEALAKFEKIFPRQVSSV